MLTVKICFLRRALVIPLLALFSCTVRWKESLKQSLSNEIYFRENRTKNTKLSPNVNLFYYQKKSFQRRNRVTFWYDVGWFPGHIVNSVVLGQTESSSQLRAAMPSQETHPLPRADIGKRQGLATECVRLTMKHWALIQFIQWLPWLHILY